MARLHHVALAVRDMDESVQWYQDKLGFELIKRYEKRGSEIAHLSLGDTRIELFNYGEETKSLPEYRKGLETDLKTIGTKHLCIEVENLDACCRELKQRGVELATEIETAGFGGEFVFFRDCNGILIELYQS